MFTLLPDGTKDRSGFENISASLRYIKNGKLFESFLKMPKADKLDAQSFMHVTSQHFWGIQALTQVKYYLNATMVPM